MPEMVEWIDWLPGYDRVQAKHYGAPFDHPPDLVVLHRPAKGMNVAEYYIDPREDDGSPRVVSTHFAPSVRTGGLVQCVSLRRIAWGQGGGIWKGDKHLNRRAISVELPVPMLRRDGGAWVYRPWPRDGWETTSTLAWCRAIAEAFPSVTQVIGHVDCSPPPPHERTDPGRDFIWDLVLAACPGWASPHRAGA